ncbi:MAG: hypothetical protein ACRDLU_03600 [Gaiellaceae bacterium]
MKRTLATITLVAGVAAGVASANGSPYSPGLVYGWSGVGAGDGVRYAAFGMPKSTIVAAVRARDGRVLRSNVVRGEYGVPLVAYDGTSGGLSGDGTALVLGSYGPLPGQSGKTRFLILNTRTLAPRRAIVLDGSWSFDAVSPDAATLYLTEHLRAGDRPLYRVRTYDARSGRLRGAIVDRLEGEEEMGGQPVARASSAGGRWAYTLYARRGDEPFVHALDTVKREAFCIDLPLRLGYGRQWGLRLELGSQGESLSVRNGRSEVAAVDTRSWQVKS